MDIFEKINKVKDAIVETAQENPTQAATVFGLGACGLLLACHAIDIHNMKKEIKGLGDAISNTFAVAQAGYVANNQCCSNLRAQVNYISKHLGIAEECEKIGAETATNIFKESGLTELDASKMVYLLERSKPVMVEFLDKMQTF